jgi:23S rRNA (uracil1939-C5)-methyltransferase
MKHRKQVTTRASRERSALVRIEKPIYGGNFLARVEGKATFVPLTLPGEEVRVRIVEEKRGYASAETEEILTPAPNRIAPGCRHFGVCGGCQYQHTDYDSQLRFKEAILRETLQRGGVQPPEQIDILAGDPWSYRNRIRLAFDSAGNPGYRARRSHAIVPISECPIASPLLVSAALGAAEILRNMKTNFRPQEISLFANADETELLTTLFVQNSETKSIENFAEALKKAIPAMAGVQIVKAGNADQADKLIADWGNTTLTYRAGGFDYQVGQGAFFQVNRWLLDKFVSRVTDGRRGSLAWDLFAGVGLFARRLAANYTQVVAVESAPASTQTLSKNLEGTAGNAITAEVSAFLKGKFSRTKPDLIVVDPPRTGLGGEVTSLLASVAVPTLMYVSCDPATLARDLRALIEAGYSVAHITLVDLFPQTFHLETVVELQRS